MDRERITSRYWDFYRMILTVNIFVDWFKRGHIFLRLSETFYHKICLKIFLTRKVTIPRILLPYRKISSLRNNIYLVWTLLLNKQATLRVYARVWLASILRAELHSFCVNWHGHSLGNTNFRVHEDLRIWHIPLLNDFSSFIFVSSFILLARSFRIYFTAFRYCWPKNPRNFIR